MRTPTVLGKTVRKCRALTCPGHTAPAGEPQQGVPETWHGLLGDPEVPVCDAGPGGALVHSNALAVAVF